MPSRGYRFIPAQSSEVFAKRHTLLLVRFTAFSTPMPADEQFLAEFQSWKDEDYRDYARI